MKRITTPAGIVKLGTIMGIWAHPDDESFMMAGLMAAAVRNGQTVVCVTATKGEAGSQDEERWPLANLGEIRADELAKGLDIIGVKHHHWLNYNDGGCHLIADQEAVSALLPLLIKYRPDTVITFPPDGVTGHLDHIAVSRWASLALQKLNDKKVNHYYSVDCQEHYDRYMRALDEKFNVYFNIDKPCLVDSERCDIFLKLPPELAGIKNRALEAMPSQTDLMFKTFGRKYMEDSLNTEMFISAKKKCAWGTPKHSG